MKLKTLEEEIQSSFRNNKHKLTINLMFTFYRLMDEIKKAYKEYNITSQQYNVLRILKGQKGNPASIQLIKERVMDKNADISRMLDRLFSKGLITRTISNNDKRKKDVLISKKGLLILEQLSEITTNFDRLFDHFSDSEIVEFNTLLDKTRIKL